MTFFGILPTLKTLHLSVTAQFYVIHKNFPLTKSYSIKNTKNIFHMAIPLALFVYLQIQMMFLLGEAFLGRW